MWSSWINLHFFTCGVGKVFLKPLLNLMHYCDASETYKLNFLNIVPILYSCIMYILSWWNVNEKLYNLHSTHFFKNNENHLQKLKHSYENCMKKFCIPQHEYFESSCCFEFCGWISRKQCAVENFFNMCSA